MCFYQYTGMKCICCTLDLDLFGRHGEIENHVRRFDYSPVNIISIQGSGLM